MIRSLRDFVLAHLPDPAPLFRLAELAEAEKRRKFGRHLFESWAATLKTEFPRGKGLRWERSGCVGHLVASRFASGLFAYDDGSVRDETIIVINLEDGRICKRLPGECRYQAGCVQEARDRMLAWLADVDKVDYIQSLVIQSVLIDNELREQPSSLGAFVSRYARAVAIDIREGN